MIHNEIKTGAVIICIGVSPYSPMHPSTPVGPAFKCCYFPQRTIILIRKVGFFTLCPITPLRTNRKGWLCLPFLVWYSVSYPGEIQSSQRQDQDRVRSCDNHIMSGRIRVSDETPLSAIQMRECHPHEQAETFPDWLSNLYGSGISIYFPGPLTPKNSSWL